MLANSKRLLFQCKHACIHRQTVFFHNLASPQSILQCFVFSSAFFSPSVARCHSERTRTAQQQVSSNPSKCTCGLSSSQSLGKYPINNPVTTSPVTPTLPHTHQQLMHTADFHTITANAHWKHMERQKINILLVTPVAECWRWRFSAKILQPELGW